MNKQELINQLEIKVKQWKAYPSDFHRGMTHAYKGALSSAEQLDEPQKPVFTKNKRRAQEYFDERSANKDIVQLRKVESPSAKTLSIRLEEVK